MTDITKSFYTIGEASKIIGEAPSLIRFWEKEFSQLKPHKSKKGTRKYSVNDIQILKLIHHLVKEKGMTLEGAKSYLKNQSNIPDQAALIEKLNGIKNFLVELKNAIPK